MVRIILDTNVLISAFLYGGMGYQLVQLGAKKKLELFISPDLKTAVLRKFQQLKADKSTLQKLHTLFSLRATEIQPRQTVKICRDPTDNFLLELAQERHAHYLITRDKDLLELPRHRWKHTTILKPEDFLSLVRKKKISLYD